MKIVFRVDGSKKTGHGHFMRCLTLADSFDSQFVEITFVSRSLSLHLQNKVRERGYIFLELKTEESKSEFGDLQHSDWLDVSQKQDAADFLNALGSVRCEWIVVDHYALDWRWEVLVRHKTKKILVIDDLADRRHDCDALFDQNINKNLESRYINLVPARCRLFLGSKYCFLRPEFYDLRNSVQPRIGRIKNILVFFGGVDGENNTEQAISVITKVLSKLALKNSVRVDVVIGSEHPALANIEAMCRKENFICHIQTNKMARLMADADLAIGAGGISTYERLYLRLPALLKATSSNQLEPLTYMSSIGLFEIFSSEKDLEEKVEMALLRENRSPPVCVENGNEKIAKYMMSADLSLKKPNGFDVARTFRWLQNKKLREDFLVSETPLRSNHFLYWRNVLNSRDQSAYAIYYLDKHVGNCGLKNIDIENCSSELWIYLADEDVRGKGVAKNSVVTLLMKAKNEYASRLVYLHVSRSNAAAIRLYDAAGFVDDQSPLDHPLAKRNDIKKMSFTL
jgi:UDP-2,4-diacetamido-2,4,6-trideoxy-beta-L-altropyranose hydrolase